MLYLLMADVMAQIARFLVSQDLGGGVAAAPTFEIHRFTTDSPLAEIKLLAQRAAALFPELNTVHEAIRGLSLLL
jgi:hypothetical protein